MAGHSKWANIRHKKEGADKRRGIMFTKLSRELMVSARLGGSDPEMNPRLRIAISKARSANMPNDNIDRAIKKGAGELEGQIFEEVVYEIYAPGGVGLIVEALTDKKSRTTPEIKSMVHKHGANLAEANAVSRLFESRGQIIVPRAQEEAGTLEEDQVMEVALEAGAEDMKSDDDSFEILTTPDHYAQVAEAISNAAWQTSESGIRYLPMEGTEIQVDAEKARNIFDFLEKLEEHDDVQSVYHNMHLSDELYAEMEKMA
ncbi:MAG TPA: YebC/PmpR family DNA-binding transcriptional regulator [Leptospiraceae bacterium]|nr:YebC/PmpR family DNA-binding transcriptional regulator [Spirochaetaceae bacterium]HBS03469.1 YebC/PmpR family DNA-binding transcriptional regulator [Leptospiraceae bacterium]|tara:strand:- start:32365 stop:33141 length:777 start_codon:yes stop_codon:yes gene_type:complete